jgi:hypothetical protein
MTSTIASKNQSEISKSYLQMFDKAWQNLQMWNKDQRAHRAKRIAIKRAK